MLIQMRLTDIAMGYFRSRALCAAARLGIADVLRDEERTVEEIAAACNANDAALHRLLRALASFGVVIENKPGVFALTPFGQPLRRDHAQSEWPSVVFWSDLLADGWSWLTESVRTGLPAMQVRPPNIASRWSQDPDATSIFHAVMGTSPAEEYMPIARAWDFSKYGTVADLGGGGGALIAAILEAYPDVNGMLVDRPDAIARATPRFEGESRCKLIAADLVQSVPAGADVYILKHVLHGMADETATTVLRNCREAVPPEGRVLIIEYVLPETVDTPDASLEARLMSDLNMLVITGGKERTASEWTRLLDVAGFDCGLFIPVQGDPVSIVEGIPRP